MKVTYKELGALLTQFQRAAQSTLAKCQVNTEEGYESRRDGDVAHAQGRLDAVLVMQAKLTELQAQVGTTTEVDSDLFLKSFSAETTETARLFAEAESGQFQTLFGRHEAYSDVTGAVRAWEHLPGLGT